MERRLKDLKPRVRIYEFESKDRVYTGSVSEIAEQAGIDRHSVLTYGEMVGSDFVIIKASRNGDEFLGNYLQMAKFFGSSPFNVFNGFIKRRQFKDYKLDFVEIKFIPKGREKGLPQKIAECGDKIVKKNLVKPRPKEPVTPMSDYWKMMFKMHTRHLEDYKKGDKND